MASLIFPSSVEIISHDVYEVQVSGVKLKEKGESHEAKHEEQQSCQWAEGIYMMPIMRKLCSPKLGCCRIMRPEMRKRGNYLEISGTSYAGSINHFPAETAALSK